MDAKLFRALILCGGWLGVVALLMPGLAPAGAEPPEMDFQVLHIQQRSYDGNSPQVAFNVTVEIENIGNVDYDIHPHDWSFQTDTGRTAFVGGVIPADEKIGTKSTFLLAPGESSTFILLAFQLGSTVGNLTTMSFQDGPPQPIGA